jgi:hypothetical protein
LRINLQKLYRKDFFPLYNIFRHPTLNSWYIYSVSYLWNILQQELNYL